MRDAGTYSTQTSTANCGLRDRSVGVSTAGVWEVLRRRPPSQKKKEQQSGETSPGVENTGQKDLGDFHFFHFLFSAPVNPH